MFNRRSIVSCCILFSIIFSSAFVHAEKKKVVFIRYPIAVSHFSTVVNGFKETMAKRGYVEGQNIEYVDVLTASADKRSIPDVMKAIADWHETTDMFITSGWVSMYVIK